MKIIDFDINTTPVNDKDLVLCLGFFDGLHLGHQKLIQDALNEGYPVSVMTFDIAPRVLLGKKETGRYCYPPNPLPESAECNRG